MNLARLSTFSFAFSIIALFLYSFTQVDLSLTLPKASVWQDIQKSFQQIGYFNRPLSALLYAIILAWLSISYVLILFFSLKKKIELKSVFALSIFSALLLSFSYNAFSYDLFNYIFDAKIITYYQENPYLKKALDFPGEPMLSFMHWTHRTYPYGPLWLALTVPFSYLSLNIFLVSFFLFKFLISAFYLGTVYVLYKILNINKYQNIVFSLALFALNPLVIVESLVSSHNDIVMMGLAMAGVYLYLGQRKLLGVLVLFASALVKFLTGALIPLLFLQKRANLFELSFLAMCFGVVFLTYRMEFQPWYLIWVLPFVPLVNRGALSLASIVASIVALSFYIPYLYLGTWPANYEAVKILGIVVSLVLGALIYFPVRSNHV